MGFSAVARKLREEAGFASARSFYRASGGVRRLACTYKAYLNVESGRSLPQPELAGRIADALGLAAGSPGASEFVSAYLRALIGREELSGLVLRALSGVKPSETDVLFRRASELSFEHRKVPLTKEQAERILSSAESYWCFTILSNERASWTAQALAAVLGFKSARILRALNNLAAAGLLRRDKTGEWRSLNIGGVYLYPRDKFYVPLYREALTQQWESMAKKRGETLLNCELVLRASEAGLRERFPSLAQGIYGSHIYALREKKPDSGLFILEARVRKLLPL